ncbi:hypothetical protein [Anaerocolumna chitinilytica]|uniref:Uncharacterized protein n=1 Tax=Anaerocolumna chitinilytica TaxID=1727145 RepID=A0A7M3SAJ9_9FIRM|nr:hypothetical protein [Anaerocolumna chitinilytica]BCK01617.1 hypothetical protein bsdcttw_46570 [Anaerocolumna chitinilytica]
MERLTDRSRGGYGILKDKGKLELALSKLATYEDTGYEPQTIKNLDKICRDQSNSIIRHGLEMEKRYNECEYWKSQSITDKSKLGILRYYFEKHGTTLEQVLEDCKTMFQDTTCTENSKM